jgi:GT2 family glycosyltransferase
LYKDIRGYDPLFFLTVEDACDLCRRVRNVGYSTLYDPRVQIKHLCGRSGAQVPFLATLEGYKGSIYYFMKYDGPIGGIAAFAIVTVGCLAKLLFSGLKFALRRRPIDRQNLSVYARILPMLLMRGPKICFLKDGRS